MQNRHSLAFVLILIAIAACTDQIEVPKGPSSPIYQAGRLQYKEDHPQLKLLGLSAAREAQIEKVELPARLVWNEEKTQRIYSPFSGRVGVISVDLGQYVSAGQVLAKLVSPEFGAVQSEAQRAQADLSLARQTNERQQKLFDIGVIARKELDQSNAELKRNEAAFTLAQNRINIYGTPSTINLELTLRSALNGVVVERNINPSQELRTDLNQPPLFVISDPTSLSPGSAIDVKVSALGDRVYPARLSVVGEQIDPVTRSIKLRAIVSNLDRSLKSDMLAKAVYQKQSKGLLEVPSAAVFLRGRQHAVFVAVNAASFELREVEVAELGTDRILIRTGLKDGEQVVTQNALLLLREIKFAEDSAQVNPMKAKP
jgi:cobalt-zinc-cadmium efflux system membrane fusion protein